MANRTFWGVVLVLMPIVAAAQSPSAVEQDVLATLHKLEIAQSECQDAVAASLRMPDHLIIPPNGALIAPGQLTTSGQNCVRRKPSTDEELRVRIYNGDTAIVTGLRVMYRPDGTPSPKLRFSSVWVKRDGAWKHASY